MRRSPSIVPGIDRDVYLVLDDFGRLGFAWRETNVQDTDLESVIDDLLEGQYSCANAAPLRCAICRSRFRNSLSGARG
jgi:hypothetical protein